MAGLYKRRKRGADGRMVEAESWSVECKTPRGWQRLPAFRDRKASEEFGRKVERLSALRLAGERDAELDKWASSLPDAMRDRLARLGVLDPRTVASGQALASHVADWKADLLARGATRQHAELSANRVERVFNACAFRRWADVSASRIQQALSELHVDKHGGKPKPSAEKPNADKPKTPLSGKSKLHYVRALRGFARWMLQDGRASDNPLAHLSGGTATEKRHERRSFEADELATLLDVTRDGPTRYCMTGAARSMLYRLAAESGLRAGELRTLTRASFKLDGGDPCVMLPGADTKNGQDARIPIRPDTATELRSHLSDKLPGAAAFTMPAKGHVAEMLRADLADARAAWIAGATTADDRAKRERSAFLSYRDDAGRVVDFHSFRVTTATLLIASGADVRTAMDVMRHSTPSLTLGVYAKRLRGSDRDAIARLPDLRSGSAAPTRQRAAIAVGGATDTAARTPTRAVGSAGKRTSTENGGGTGGGKGGGNESLSDTRVCASLPTDGRLSGGRNPTNSFGNTRESTGKNLNWARQDSNLGRQSQRVYSPSPENHKPSNHHDLGELTASGGGTGGGNLPETGRPADLPAPHLTMTDGDRTDADGAGAGADSDLSAVIAAWPDLPAPIRAGVLAMVRAAATPGGTR